MRNALRWLIRGILAMVVMGVVLTGYWLGLVPSWLSPIRPPDLSRPPGWFVDAQLSLIRDNPGVCRSVLTAPQIVATPIPDKAVAPKCGWKNAVKVATASGVRVSIEPITCEMAAGIALWIANDVQPAAEELLGSKVTSISDFGTYDCRRMIGNPLWKDYMSEHASANAWDISGFTLADGRKITLLKHWKGTGPEAKFLRRVHQGACRYFRVSLGPDFNVAHRDHFHIDRGLLWTCK